MKKLILSVALLLSANAFADANKLRVFTWDGYVTAADLAAVNKLLEAAGNPVRAEQISTVAEGPDQMFDVLRSGKADLSFLTLNYIKMNQEKTAKLLQPIDTSKLKNYGDVLPSLKDIPMGVSGGKPLYVPYGGGAYGIWANMKKLKAADLPKSINDLLDPKWKGKLSLTKGQIQPNIALMHLALGKPAFHLNDLIVAGKREDAAKIADKASAEQKFMNQLYGQVGSFWGAAPDFKDPMVLVASYGIEIAGLRAKGEQWELVPFKEGNTVWLDTMNLHKDVSGKKLEAAYIFMDYFFTNAVQERVVTGLSMVAVTKNVKNPLIQANPNFFDKAKFWPPYEQQADNLMKAMSNEAMTANGVTP